LRLISSRLLPLRFSAALCVAAGLLALAGPVAAQPVKTDHVTAELVAERSGVRPGDSLQIGLRLQHIPHWHTYWRNPGDSGLPTALTWALPAGASTGDIEWPAPKRLPIGPLVNYGYEGDLLLPLRFTAPANAKPGSTLTLRAQATWLVCKDVCIPESADLELQLPVVDAATEPGATALTAAFAQASSVAAGPLQGWNADLQRAGGELLLTLTRSGGATGAPLPLLHVFPFAEQVVEPARHEVFATPQGYAFKLGLLENAKLPAVFDGVVVLQGGTPPWGGARTSAEFSAPAREVAALALPAGAVALGDTGASGGAVSAKMQGSAGGAGLGLLAALAFAFIGGMVLNLMPCVFPVLSIKLLNLAQQPASPAGLRRHAAFYAGGVLLTFLALAAVLLALRAAGTAVGWGFQLQEPGVVFVLALLFFALGLNLMGSFEFGNLAPQGLTTFRSRHPAVDAFASGALAVLAASPCTAPFMGAALGFAIAQPPLEALSVFAALGLGMALPYVALVLLPGWRARLPRPGPWMLRLKQGLAFPMFATVVWLLWVLGLQTGIDGLARALLALVALGFAIWAVGVLASKRAWATGVGAALLAVWAWSWPGAGAVAAANSGVTPAGDASGRPAGSTAETAGRWLPYDDAQLARLAAEGQPVFVDFTAAWCVSCQVNKRLVLQREDTLNAFAAAKVVLMRADWTQRDERITAALARLGRNGVPVYVLMRPGKEPLLLPEILTNGLVRDALATL